jgi:hypothetical protein
MRSISRIVLWAGSCAALAGTAIAADLTGPEIKALLYGKTVSASASGKAGQGVIYWGEDGTALYKTGHVLRHAGNDVGERAPCVQKTCPAS